MEQIVSEALPPLSLQDAVSIYNHFRHLVGGYYDLSNPGLGKIGALIIHTYDKRDETIGEYKAQKLASGKVYRAARHRCEEYDILLVAHLNHPQMKTQFEIFKDLRTYLIEQSIDFPFSRAL
jgi:hypothetical protein